MGAFDQEPRSLALAARGLDMARAGEIFSKIASRSLIRAKVMATRGSSPSGFR